jgi:hypothetical protein
MLGKFILVIKFFFSYYLTPYYHNKTAQNIIIIDGPTSVDVSNILFNLTEKIHFFVPIQYIPSIVNTDIRKRAVLPKFHITLLMIITSLMSSIGRNSKPYTTTLSSKLICHYINSNHSLLKNIVTFNERNWIPFSAIFTANSLKISTSCIQHGAIVEKYFPIYVNTYFTWSSHFSELINQRCSTVTAINVGKLNFEPPAPNTSSFKALPLVILQPGDVSISYDLLFQDFVDIIKTCLETFNGVILRPHPNDNISKKIIEYFNYDDRILFDHLPLNDSLSKTKIAISLYSTVLIEASLSGCLAIQYINEAWYLPIFKRSKTIVDNPRKLKRVLEEPELFSNYPEESFLSAPNYPLFLESLGVSKG